MAPSLYESDGSPHRLDEFPYKGSIEAGKQLTINSKEEMWDIIINLDMPVEHKYSLVINRIASPKNLIDFESRSLVDRYIYCKDFNTQPFPGSYGDQPGWWIDAYPLIANSIDSASKRLNNNKKAEKQFKDIR